MVQAAHLRNFHDPSLPDLVHRTEREVAAMFAEERPHLLPLPLEPFRYYGERVVHLNGCVEVEAAYYSLPPGWMPIRLVAR